MEHVLLTVKPGIGKTLLVQAILNEIDHDTNYTSGSVLTKESDLVTILTELNDGDYLYIDVIDRMNKKCEDIIKKSGCFYEAYGKSAEILSRELE